MSLSEMVNETDENVAANETTKTAKKNSKGNTAARRTSAAKKKDDEPKKSNEEAFNEEAAKVEVPTSIGANVFRQQLNNIIENSQLHPEVILEILRSCLAAVESVATEVANKEMAEYQNSIQALRDKYGIK